MVDIKTQTLTLYSEGEVALNCKVSTAKAGVGNLKDSFKTPLGHHMICEKIGENAPLNAVFVGRKQTGEIYSKSLLEAFPCRDFILTRILWLSGLEEGKNQGGEVDTRERYIYIHGCPDECPLGIPLSHGCIRMCNSDVIALFDKASIGMPVLIK